MKEYDAIVIGAGNSGLVAALTLQKQGKKVLILEKNNIPGGLSTSIQRGRFNFEVSLQELNNDDNCLLDLFERLNISIPMAKITTPLNIISLENSEKYRMPLGEEEFIKQMVKYVPESKNGMLSFFRLGKEIKLALDELFKTTDDLNINTITEKYPNFIKVSPYSTEKVLKEIGLPIQSIKILSAFWVYFGENIKELSFVQFAYEMVGLLSGNWVIPKNGSREISEKLSMEFTKRGGTINYLSPVTKIEVENNEVKAVLTNEEKFITHHVIADISPNRVYKDLINSKDVPLKARQLTNSRILGPSEVCVYLGLNKSLQELGLTDYQYFICHSLDWNKEKNRMKKLNLVATILSNEIETTSSNTTTLMLTSLIQGSDFRKMITKDNYFANKEEIAERLLTSFEKATNTNIRESIEEIEVATPITFARYTGHPSGVTYGYLPYKYDNLLPRLLNEKDEIYIKGLHFCGSFGRRLANGTSTYLNGEETALKELKEMNK